MGRSGLNGCRFAAMLCLVLGISFLTPAQTIAQPSQTPNAAGHWPITLWAEPLLLEYDRVQDTRVGAFPSEGVTERFTPAFRGQIEFQTPLEGTSVTVRGFLFHQIRALAVSRRPQERLTIKTWSTDVALTKQLKPNDYLVFDISAGARYNEFIERMWDDADLRLHSFKGIGPMVGIEARAYLQKDEISKFAVFARTRGAVLFGDGFSENDRNPRVNLDSRVREQLEVAAGIEATRMTESGLQFFVRVFGEFQLLADHVSKFQAQAGAPNGINENVFAGSGDAYLYGGGLRVGVRW